MEADQLKFILVIPFPLSTNMFGTCFTKYDTKVGMILQRLITMVTKRIHEDYRIEYEDKINAYLTILQRKCNHIVTIFGLPKSI